MTYALGSVYHTKLLIPSDITMFALIKWIRSTNTLKIISNISSSSNVLRQSRRVKVIPIWVMQPG